MARIVGIDCLSPVTAQLLNQAAAAMGQSCAFVGRYINPKPAQDPGDYSPAEGSVLSPFGIRVLPIARQTNHVGGARSLGHADGLVNAQDVVRKFGIERLVAQGGRVKIFLDVEGNGLSHMSAEYYLGWSEGLLDGSGGITFEPCVYGIPGDGRTWTALADAISRGGECAGVWLSHPYVADYVKSHEPIQWAPNMLKPYAIDVPILLWQYGFLGAFDANIVNPNLADATAFLRTLPLP